MIDFHIEINEQLPLSSAIIYAKNLGLRIAALIETAEYIPSVSNIPDASGTEDTAASTLQKKHIKNSPFLQQLMEKQQIVHKLSIYYDMQLFFGVQLRHIPPALLDETIRFYRGLGIELIAVHGESISDIVEKGTNFSAITAKADILYNPGLIDEKCVELAKENNVYLEISTHQKHAYTNAHIAKLAHKYGAKLVLGSSARTLHEIHSPEMQDFILKGACIENHNNYELLQKLQQNHNI